jgi:hypothetical protein
MQKTFDLSSARELDGRTADGIDVRLLWHEPSNQVCVHVVDARTAEEFVVAVDGADALGAFHHPFAYASAGDRRSALLLHDERPRKEVAR